MKKLVRISAFLLICVMAVSLLTACAAKPSGTYKSAAVASAYTAYTFKGDKVTVSIGSALGTADVATGSWELKTVDGAEKIVLSFGEDGAKYSGTFSFEQVDGKTIKISGVTYTKD